MNPDGTALFVSSAILMTIYRQCQSHIIPASLLPSTLQSPSLISPSAVPHRKIWFGEEALTHLQSKARYDMSPLDDLSLFVSWCRETNTSRLKEDEEYRLKATQRNIRVQHKEDLLSLQKQLQEAQERWKDHALFVRHQTLVREIEGKEKAIANMERFLKIDLATITKDSEREKILRTRVAFETNQAEVRGMQEELATLLALPDHQRVIACQDALQILTSSLGLDQIKTDLAHTQKERGGKRGDRGRSFEDDCADAVLVSLCPSTPLLLLSLLMTHSSPPFPIAVPPFAALEAQVQSLRGAGGGPGHRQERHTRHCQLRREPGRVRCTRLSAH
jgi:hypothetical protein